MQKQSNNENLEYTEMPLLLIKSQQRELDSIHKTIRNACIDLPLRFYAVKASVSQKPHVCCHQEAAA